MISSDYYKNVQHIKMDKLSIFSFIKTECGLEKYDLLKSRKGVFLKIRFYWFIVFASIRDAIFNK